MDNLDFFLLGIMRVIESSTNALRVYLFIYFQDVSLTCELQLKTSILSSMSRIEEGS